jgi:hypothetical protein
MLREVLKAWVFAGCISFAITGALAQQVVHAFGGIVSEVNPRARTITVAPGIRPQKQNTFKDIAISKSPVLLDKKVRDDTVPVDTVKEQGTYVIVYYFSDGTAMTALALRNLGRGPFTEAVGTVVRFEGREHSILIRDKSGAVQSFKISPDTIAESSNGVVEGFKFEPEKGDLVRITVAEANGSAAALFIDGCFVD